MVKMLPTFLSRIVRHELFYVKVAPLPLDLSVRPSGHDDDHHLEFGVFLGESARYGIGLTCILPMFFSHPGGSRKLFFEL